MAIKFYLALDTTYKGSRQRHYQDEMSDDDYIHIHTEYYGIYSPHFYFAISDLTPRRQLASLMQSEECQNNFGHYYGQDMSHHGYPEHGVNFRLNNPEKINEFLNYIASVLELTPEISGDMVQFIKTLPHIVKIEQQKQQLAEIEKQKQQLDIEAKKLEEAIARCTQQMNAEISFPSRRSVDFTPSFTSAALREKEEAKGQVIATPELAHYLTNKVG